MTGFLGIEGADYWDDPYKNEDDVVDDLLDGEELGYFLDGPVAVDLNSRASLPLVVATHLSLSDARGVDLRRCALLVTVHQERGEVHVGRAFRWKQSPSKPQGAGPAPEGTQAEMFVVQAREQISDLPWESGTLWSQLVVLGQATNRVETTLGPGSGSAAETPLRQIWPPEDEGADYSSVSDAPALNDGANLALSVPRVVVDEAGAKCVLKGRYRLPVAARDVVPGPPTDPQARSAWEPPDVGDRSASAMVPITLVLAQQSDLEPLVFNLVLPVRQEVDSHGGTVVDGAFAIDLFSLPEMLRLPQTYHIWAYSGVAFCGPIPMAIVSEEMLTPA